MTPTQGNQPSLNQPEELETLLTSEQPGGSAAPENQALPTPDLAAAAPERQVRRLKLLTFGLFGAVATVSLVAGLTLFWHHSKSPQLAKLPAGALNSQTPMADSSNQTLHINFDAIVDGGRSLTATGNVLVQNEVNSVASFAVQDSAGSNLLVADTTNGRVGVGAAPTASNTAALQVTGNISTNGALVSTTNAFALNNQGLSIGGVLVCTAAGCTAANVPAPIDTSTFAQLAGNQTFSGTNTFTAQLQAGGGINSLKPYQFNGADGLTFSCPVGNLITEPEVEGGIITGGSCVSMGSGVTQVNNFSGAITLQGTANRILVSNNAGTITFSTPQDIAVTSAPTFAGLSLTNPLTVANGGLGNSTLPANGALPIGNGSGYSISTLTAGTGITIVNGAGAITVAAPTAGTCPTCANQSLSNLSSVAINTSLLPQNPAAIDLGSNANSFRDLYLAGTAFVNNLKRINGANSTTLTILNPTATVTYQLQAAAAGTYDICTTAGNCVGAGGGVTTTGGSTNRLAKFVGSAVIGDSLITDNGSLVSISVPLSVPSVQTTSGGVTNSLTFATPAGSDKTITIPNASGTVAVNASAPLAIDANGTISCPTCITSAVTTVNTFSGAISLQGTPNQVLLNNSAGTITFATPQDIAITSSPTFANLTLTNPLTVANGGLGSNSVPANGQIPIGNGSAYVPAVLTAGTGISITNGPGSITISTACPNCANTSLSNLSSVAINTSLLPQNPAAIDLGSDTNTFRDLFLAGTVYVNNLSRVDGVNSTTLTIADPTANVTYVLPTASGGPYEICTTAGNCGIGNAITGSGTQNQLAKFSSTNGITDSIISDDGTTVTVGGTLSVNTLTPTGALTLGAGSQSVLLQGSTVTLNATAAGITNSLVFATPAASNKTITVPNATGTIAVSATGPISLDANGNISCPSCLTSGGGGGTAGVSSLNLLTGDLVLQGTTNQVAVTAAGTSITLALPQDIATTSSPTFQSLHLGGGSLDTTAGGTTNVLNFETPAGANKTVTVPNQSGTICLDSANCSSAALSNNSDLAKLSGSGPQTFTGDNKFAGSFLAQDAVESATAFQIQNPIGSSVLAVDTTALNSFLSNSSFEGSDVSAWAYLGTPGLVSRSTAQAYIGGASLKVVTTANPSNGIKFVTGNGAGALATSTTYTVSWYDKLDAASAAFNDIRATYARDGIAQTACSGINIQVVSATGWTRHSCQITTDATAPAAGAFISIQQTGATAHTFYVDAVQVEANTSATAYRETGLSLNGVINSPVAFKNQSDSVTAFQIQNAAGTSNLFIADTINNRIGIGKLPTSYNLDVAGTIGGSALYQNGNQVCDTSGNCVGNSGGALGGSGTAGNIAKFTGSGFTVGDSIITDDGTTVTIGGTLSVNTIMPTAAITIGSASEPLTLQGSTFTATASNGGFTNTLTFAAPATANHTITIPNASGTVAVSATGPLSLDAAGNLSCPTCVTSAVNTLNGFSGVVNLQGTPNQVLVNNSAGTITLATPQDIAITSSPTFAGLTLSSTPLGVASGGLGTGAAPANGALPIGNGTDYVAATLTAGSGISIVNGPGSIQISSSCPGCANTSLSNLSAVAINANLNPQTTATIDLGSSTTTFRDLYLSDAAYLNSLKRVNGANTVSLNILAPTSNVTYQLPSASAGTYDICTTSGNCTGGNGSGIGGAGTLNKLAKFTNSGFTIGDSGITDDGTTVTIAEDTQLQAGLDVTSVINTATGFSVAGVAGASQTCAANELLQAATIAGGIITGATCQAPAGQTTPTFQDVYDASATSPQLTLNSTNGGLVIQDAATPLGSSLFTVQSNGGATKYLDVTATGVAISGTVTATGDINSSGGNIQTAGVTRIDNSGNLTNIGNISGSGTIQLSGASGSSYIMSSLGLGTMNPQGALTIANGDWISSIDASGSGYIDMFSVNSDNQIQAGAALAIDGGIVLPTNAGQVTFSDLPIDSSATAGTPESYTMRVGSTNALTVYGESDGAGGVQNVRVAVGSSITPGYTLDVGGDVNTTGVYRINGVQISSSNLSNASNVALLDRTGQIFTGDNTFKLDSATAFQIQNAAGTSNLFVADTTNTRIGIGMTPTNTATFQVQTAGTDDIFQGYSAGVLRTKITATGNQTWVVSNGSELGAITIGAPQATLGITFKNQLGANRTDIKHYDNTGGGIQIGNGTDNYATITPSSTSFRSLTNSTTAFRVQDASGTNLLNVDSTNGGAISLLGNNSGELSAWTLSSKSLPSPLNSPGTVIANGYLYVVGGGGSGLVPQTTVYYAKLNADGSLNSFATSSNPLPVAKIGHTTVAANGYIYAIGGDNSVLYAKLNPDGSTGTWQTSPYNLSSAISYHTSVVANGYVYVIGGKSGGSALSSVYYAKLNPDGTTGPWITSANNLPGGIYSAASVVANGYVYVTGGQITGGVDQSTVWYAKLNTDGSTGAWQVNPNPLPQTRVAHGSVAVNGYLYAIAGSVNTNPSGSVAYAKLNANGSTGTWNTAATSAAGKSSSGFAMANGYIYQVGGGPGAYDTVYYASTSRVQISGSLDLLGGEGGNLAANSGGGALTSGNARIVGTLSVADSTMLQGALAVGSDLNVSGSSLFQNTTDSTTAFQIQRAGGSSLFVADTTNSVIGIGGAPSPTSVTGSGSGAPLQVYYQGQQRIDIGTHNGGAIGIDFINATHSNVARIQLNDSAGGGLNFCASANTSCPDGQIRLTTAGTVAFQASVNSTAALQIQNASGTQLFDVNTTDGYVINNGTTTPGNELTNPSFEGGTGNFISGWELGGSASIANNGNARTGNYELVLPSNTSSYAYSARYYEVTPGDQLDLQAWVKNATGTNGTSSMMIWFYNRAKGVVASLGKASFAPPGTTYTLEEATVTVPANAFYARVLVNADASSTTGTWYVDDMRFVNTTSRSPAIFQNATNSTTAFQIQNANGTNVLAVDTTNQRVSVGSVGTATGQLYVSGAVPTQVGSISTGLSGPNGVFVSGRYAYLTSFGNNTLAIFDVSNPASPTAVGSTSTGLTQPGNVYVVGKYAYVASSGKLSAFDVSNPASPTLASSTTTGLSGSTYVYVQGRYAYVTSRGNNTLAIFDVSNPTNSLALVGSLPINNANVVYVQGLYAYVTTYSSNKLDIIDVSNPAAPSLKGATSTTGINVAGFVRVSGRYAYLTSFNNSTMLIYDISNPTSPVKVGSTTSGLTGPSGFWIQGRYAYVTNQGAGNNFTVLDISNPAAPSLVGTTSTGLNVPVDVFVQGRYAYVGSYVNNSLVTFDLGGTYTQQLEAGGAEFGTLQVDSNGQVAGDFNIQGGLNVGQSLQASGSAGIQGGLSVQGGTILGGGKNQLGAPTSLAATPAAGGSLTAGTYKYEVTAIDASGGETIVSNEATGTTASTNLTINLSWTAPSGGTPAGYKIYRTVAGGASGTETYLATIATNSYSDTGSAVLSTATAPTSDTTGQLTVQGSALFKNSTNSTTAFQVQNASGTQILNVDTTNQRVSVGSAGTATGQLYVAGRTPTSTLSTTTTLGTAPTDVKIVGHYAYVLNDTGSNALQVFDITNPATPASVGSVVINVGRHLVIQGNYAYVVSWASSTLQVIDVSNPSSPSIVSTTSLSGTGGQDVAVQGRYVYIITWNGKTLETYDVANPKVPKLVNTVSTGANNYRIAIQGSYAYVSTYTPSSLRIYNLSNPASPSFTGASGSIGTEASSLSIQGRYAYVAASNSAGFIVVDVSNPASPTVVSSLSGTDGFNNGFEVIAQGRYAYVISNTSSTLQTINIANPAVSTSVLGTVATGPSPIGFTVSGRYAYVVDGSGLQVFDLGGTYTQQLEAGGAEVGTLQVDSNGQVAGDFNIQGGLNIGQSLQTAGNAGIQGGLSVQGGTILDGGNNQLSAPAMPTVTPQGTAGTQRWDYAVTAVNAYSGETTASAAGSTATGNATLDATNFNRVSWTAVPGAVSYKIYRVYTTGATSPLTSGLIGTTTTTSFDDTGLAAAGSVPTVNTTGQLTVQGAALFQNKTNSTTAFQIQNAAGTSNLFVADTVNNTIGINTAADSTAALSINKNFGTLAAGFGFGTGASIQSSATANSDGTSELDGLDVTGNLQGANNSSLVYGGSFTAKNSTSSGALLQNAYGLSSTFMGSGAGDTVNANGLFTEINLFSSGDVSVAKGLNVASPFASSTGRISTDYGLYVDTQKTSAVSGTAYGIYQAGSSDLNYFAGATTIKNNSTAAFQVQNASGTALITADTANTKVNIGGDLNVGTTGGKRIFTDNFESNNTSLWDPYVAGTAPFTESTTVHSGMYAAQFAPAAGPSYLSYAWGSGSDTAYTREWVNVSSQTGSRLNVMSMGQNTSANEWYVYRNGSNQVCVWNDFTGASVGCGGSFTTGAWHKIELRITSATTTTGTTQLWLDDSSIINLSNQNNGNSVNPAAIVAGSDDGLSTGTFYIDDVSADSSTDNSVSRSLSVDGSLHVGGASTFGIVNIQPQFQSTQAFSIWAPNDARLFNVDTANKVTTLNTDFQVQNAAGVTILGINTTSGVLFSNIPDGASAVGFTLNVNNTYSTAGAKLLSIQNNGSEKFAINKDGRIVTALVPALRVYLSTFPTYNSGSAATLTFDSETFDTDNMHDTSINNDRLVCTSAGLYQINAAADFADNGGGGNRAIWIDYNGSDANLIAQANMPAVSGDDTVLNVSTLYRCNAGDYFTIRVYQNSGSVMNITNDTTHATSMAYIGP